VVCGVAVSAQAARRKSVERWRERVEQAAREALPEGYWLLAAPLAVTIYLFPDSALHGDVDNRVKPVLDGMKGCVFIDDNVVERIVVQKFEPDRVFGFSNPSATLAKALDGEKPLIYVRVSDDLHEELV
jgi:hypothetical protein